MAASKRTVRRRERRRRAVAKAKHYQALAKAEAPLTAEINRAPQPPCPRCGGSGRVSVTRRECVPMADGSVQSVTFTDTAKCDGCDGCGLLDCYETHGAGRGTYRAR